MDKNKTNNNGNASYLAEALVHNQPKPKDKNNDNKEPKKSDNKLLHFVDDEQANLQINQIRDLVISGKSDREIADIFTQEEIINLKDNNKSWSQKDICAIRNGFSLGDNSQDKTLSMEVLIFALGFIVCWLSVYLIQEAWVSWTPEIHNTFDLLIFPISVLVSLIMMVIMVGILIVFFGFGLSLMGVSPFANKLLAWGKPRKTRTKKMRKCPRCGKYISRHDTSCQYCNALVVPLYVDNIAANRQIVKILSLDKKGLGTNEIIDKLNNDGDKYLHGDRNWNEDRISYIINTYQ